MLMALSAYKERPVSRPLYVTVEGRDYFIDEIRVLILSACGPSSLASLSSIGLEIFWKADLSTSVTILMPIPLSLPAAAASSSKAFFGSCVLTTLPAARTHFFWSSFRLVHSLSLIQRMALLASCWVIDSTGAGS